MKQQKQWLVSIAGALIALIISSVASAATVPLENRLPAWGDYGTKTIDFTNIDVTYTNGKVRKGVTEDTIFFAESTASSLFFLNSPLDGYNNVGFNGYLVIDAHISSKGVLRAGSTFGIYSQDAMFGTGHTGTYNCSGVNNDKNCTTGQLVYGGDLTAFGWSGSQGILEFAIANLAGWAHDNWAPDSMGEHLLLDTGPFDLNNVSSVKSFNAIADGFAVVPVPAAAWLLGSGLLGLVGVARRKQRA